MVLYLPTKPRPNKYRMSEKKLKELYNKLIEYGFVPYKPEKEKEAYWWLEDEKKETFWDKFCYIMSCDIIDIIKGEI